MKESSRATKLYIKHLPPILATKLIDEYKIPTPFKEVLIAACVENKGGFKGVEYLSKQYGINISYWQFVNYLAIGLDKFYKTHTYLGKDYSEYLTV